MGTRIRDTIRDTIKGTDTKDLMRAYNTNKAFLVFNVSVFNVGVAIRLICTNDYIRYQNISKDGYSFCVESDAGIKEDIRQELKKRLMKINAAWGKFCYYEPFSDFLKHYKLTDSSFKMLQKIAK